MLDVAIEAAREGGRVLIDKLNEPRKVKLKGEGEIVTDADLAAQEAIQRVIGAHYPDHDILSEESAQKYNGHPDYRWIIDPLDGTTNYSRRYPCFSVSIAVSFRGEVVLGVVYDPLHEQLFEAQHGEGAYLNGRRLKVSERRSCKAALVGLDWAHGSIRAAEALVPVVGTLRTLGSAALALCYVASGLLDAHLNLAMKPWDGAAASLIVREAGGRVTDLAGQPWQLHSHQCLASNGLVHEEILDIVRGI